MSEITNQADPLTVTKERVKAWGACTDGYRWFLEKFPQGGEFAEVYAALWADKRYDDSGWLSDRVFAELDAQAKVRQTVLISGADKAKIELAAKEAGTADKVTATTGYRANAATTGEGAVAAALGLGGKVKAGAGGAIVIVNRDDSGALRHIFASKIGENGIEADVWYELDKEGNPQKVEEDES